MPAKSRYMYRSTSLTRFCPPLGPYSRPMPRHRRWSWGRMTISYERGTPVQGYLAHKKTSTPLGLRRRPTVGCRWGAFSLSEVPLYTNASQACVARPRHACPPRRHLWTFLLWAPGYEASKIDPLKPPKKIHLSLQSRFT